MSDRVLPLQGIRILDLTRLLPGPFCTRLLADQGADVVKVEDPTAGDYARHISPDIFNAMNHGKRSIILDLRQESGRSALLRLAPRFHVLVESFRPGVMERLGCGYTALSKANPRLIYCALTGYGQEGEYAARSGHDLNYMSLAGLLSGASGPLPVQAADFCGGYLAAFRIAAALRGGQGCFLDVSLTESVLPMAVTRKASNRLEGALACYSLYPTVDGQMFSLGALEPKFFAAFCEAVGRPELAAMQFDESRQDELRASLKQVFVARSTTEWESFFQKVDACGAPVRRPSPAAYPPGPKHGEHTREVLAEIGEE